MTTVEDPRSPEDRISFPSRRGATCPFDPPPAYIEAGRSGPVSRVRLWDGSPCWLLTGYQAVRTALSDRRFSADVRTPGFPFLTPNREQFTKRMTPSFLRMDDPEHARLRRMLTGDFIIKRVEAQRPQIQAVVDEVLDAMIAEGSPADLVTRFALPVPSLVICLLLGVPYEDHGFFQQASRTLLDSTVSGEQFGEAVRQLTEYLTLLAERKRAEPDDSILGRLMAREELGLDEAAATGLLLLVAGHETTANMIGLGTLTLLNDPGQAAELRARPELMPGAVEELLRYHSIVHAGLPRVALEDVELEGTLIRAGEGVVCMVSTANRDEEVFTGGGQFELDRDARRHLAFGFGVHQCLGQPLARAELQIALETLLRRLPGLRLAVPFEQVGFRDEMLIYGVRELPVAW